MCGTTPTPILRIARETRIEGGITPGTLYVLLPNRPDLQVDDDLLYGDCIGALAILPNEEPQAFSFYREVFERLEIPESEVTSVEWERIWTALFG
jgi:hypothetical protein